MKDRLTICACRHRGLIPAGAIEQMAEQARREGRQVEIVDDLCALMEDGDETTWAQLDASAVAACHERAVKSLLEWRGVKASSLTNLRVGAGSNGPGNDAWYPTIDKDRCTECGKCFDFCPFSVYDMVDDRVRVVRPHSCKNNCPSCARNCPSEAIIFPKYGRSPINGGTDHEEEALRVDHSTLYSDAFRARLAERRNKVQLIQLSQVEELEGVKRSQMESEVK